MGLGIQFGLGMGSLLTVIQAPRLLLFAGSSFLTVQSIQVQIGKARGNQARERFLAQMELRAPALKQHWLSHMATPTAARLGEAWKMSAEAKE